MSCAHAKAKTGGGTLEIGHPKHRTKSFSDATKHHHYHHHHQLLTTRPSNNNFLNGRSVPASLAYCHLVLVKLLVQLPLPLPALSSTWLRTHPTRSRPSAITSRLPITGTHCIPLGPRIKTLWGKEHHIEPPRVQFRDVETKCRCRRVVLILALPLP